LGNAFYHALQNYSSSCLISKNTKIKIYKTIILHVVLYGYEIWCHTKEEHGLRVSENRVLRRIFRPKGDEVMRGWGKLHNEELQKRFTKHY
jgi:hypothetical protein